MPRHALSPLINLSLALLLIFVAVSEANKEYWWMNDQSLFESSNSIGSGGGNYPNQGSGGCGGNGGGCGGNNGGGNFQSHSSGGSGGCGGNGCGGGNQFNSGTGQHSSGGSSAGWPNKNNFQGSSGNSRPAVDPQPLRTPAPKRRPSPSRNSGCGGGGYGGGGNCGNSVPAPSRPASGAAVVQTECPSGSKCVAEHFCDANGVMSNSRVDLTQYEKEQRGEMISCMMNQNTGSWGICCGIPSNRQPSRPANNNFNNQNNHQSQQPSRPSNNNHNNQNRQPSRPSNNNFNNQNRQPSRPANNNFNNQNRQPSRPANNNFNNQNRQPSRPANNNFNNQNNIQQSCPSVNNLPPVEACAGRSSNCWSVGQADVDCPGNALCCFDGCANTCQGGGGTPRGNRGR